jgi:hypothetical protein
LKERACAFRTTRETNLLVAHGELHDVVDVVAVADIALCKVRVVAVLVVAHFVTSRDAVEFHVGMHVDDERDVDAKHFFRANRISPLIAHQTVAAYPHSTHAEV